MKGKALEMSVGLFTAAISVAFVGGAAAVWVTAGLTWSLPGDGSGSNADWLAAYGTWAIGLGAIFFALAGHLQRRDEIRHAKVAAAEERRAHVTSAVLALGDAVCVKDSIESFLSLPADQQIYGRLVICTRMLRDLSRPAGVSVDALKHLPLEASTLAARINAGLEAVRGLVVGIEMDGRNPLPEEEEVLKVDLDLCVQISGIADELLELCEEFRAIAMRVVNTAQAR
ncbi:hypothetical protein JY420_01305 [Stenotrophomonas maltophilia]|nr:hypothetical protein [Stenotrophomonas maltophilia]MBN5132811.1 hypothetical protein [Stenotrophomonas maltophilia]